MNEPSNLKHRGLYHLTWDDGVEDILIYKGFLEPDAGLDRRWHSSKGRNYVPSFKVLATSDPDRFIIHTSPRWEHVLKCEMVEVKDLPLFINFQVKHSEFLELLKEN